MVTRFGGPDGTDLVLGDDPENSDAFGHMVVYGYFLIIIVQIIGVVLEEDYNFQVVSRKTGPYPYIETSLLAWTLLPESDLHDTRIPLLPLHRHRTNRIDSKLRK